MTNEKVIGVDLGATNIRAATVKKDTISGIQSKRINSRGSVEEVLKDVFEIVDTLVDNSITAIGIGVPGVVDVEQGVVYDVQYIPSWKEVPLKREMEQRYNLPVFVNNDANCFALGEHYFGKGIDSESMIGLTIGTGVGAGIIINKKLYAGYNCGAGEFGMVDYLDKVYEYYCSGSFFKNVYQLDGEEVFERAKKGDAQALELYAEMGTHLGNAIKLVMYAYDPSLIILGGSVRMAYDFFQQSMWQRIKTFAYTKSAKRIKIEISELENSGILGAAALYYDYVQ
ncbi:ROK family protein [Segetibacter koreensis]|uniref:ROK family protein n=1 Tax=Segetibacter koreensis TaxID=398037 RepID=UPI0004759878|nr:ROK family protein [Segetibacter koreensis]